MSTLQLDFRFTPADGSAPRDIHITIETQENERRPFKLTIDWTDGRVERMQWPGPPLSGLELCSRYIAYRILDNCELWGPGTLHPEVERPHPLVGVEPLPPAKDDESA